MTVLMQWSSNLYKHNNHIFFPCWRQLASMEITQGKILSLCQNVTGSLSEVNEASAAWGALSLSPYVLKLLCFQYKIPSFCYCALIVTQAINSAWGKGKFCLKTGCNVSRWPLDLINSDTLKPHLIQINLESSFTQEYCGVFFFLLHHFQMKEPYKESL